MICKVTEKLWSCEEIGWKVKNCKIQLFKTKRLIEEIRFTILKPKVDP
ncbi:MAG: hypothetical protein RMI31_02155 [Archaeoglobaceae archaeon]|nr:hypothetical protein [Archaeoglobaceae archaeon]